jgi:hypothetical protein
VARGARERQLRADFVEKLGILGTLKIPPKLMASDFYRSTPSRIDCGGFG